MSEKKGVRPQITQISTDGNSRKCDFFGCENTICEEAKLLKPTSHHYCQEHHDQLNSLMEQNNSRAILAFWVKANGGAKRNAEKTMQGMRNNGTLQLLKNACYILNEMNKNEK